MSDSDQDKVGYKKPPRQHRFSQENQPHRRKRKVPKGMGHSVLANIIHAMSEDVSFTLDGKPAKATAGYVFARRLVKQGVSGTLNEQIKLANFLRTFGELNLESIREDGRKKTGGERPTAPAGDSAKISCRWITKLTTPMKALCISAFEKFD